VAAGFLVVAAIVLLMAAGVTVASPVVATTIGLGEDLATHHSPNVKSI
jgi:hypothetical protein